jgi:hypothetical protein
MGKAKVCRIALEGLDAANPANAPLDRILFPAILQQEWL